MESVSIMESEKYDRFILLASLVESCRSPEELSRREVARVLGYSRLTSKRRGKVQLILEYADELVIAGHSSSIAGAIRDIVAYLRSARSSRDLDFYLGRKRMSPRLQEVLDLFEELS